MVGAHEIGEHIAAVRIASMGALAKPFGELENFLILNGYLVDAQGRAHSPQWAVVLAHRLVQLIVGVVEECGRSEQMRMHDFVVVFRAHCAEHEKCCRT